jgi:hypothetical protein
MKGKELNEINGLGNTERKKESKAEQRSSMKGKELSEVNGMASQATD